MTQTIVTVAILLLLVTAALYHKRAKALPRRGKDTVLVVFGSHRKVLSKKRVNCAIKYLAESNLKVDHILFAGKGPGIKHGYRRLPEADFMRWYYEQRISTKGKDLSRPNILVENESMNTHENVKNSVVHANRLSKGGVNVILLSTHNHIFSAATAWQKRRPTDDVFCVLCPSTATEYIPPKKKKK